MIRGKTRAVIAENDIPQNRMGINASIHNRFDVEVRDAQTGEIRQRAQAKNIVLNNFWTLWASTDSNNYNFRKISIGSGTGVLDVTRTELFTKLGIHNLESMTFTRDNANCVYVAKGQVVLGETLYVGSTITEVGLTGQNQTTIITHAQLKDMNGNPISIVKTDTDIITIYATLYVHWTTEALNGVNLMDSMLHAIAGGGGLTVSQHCTYAVLVSGATVSLGTPTITVNRTNKTFTVKFPRIGAAVANGHGIKQLLYLKNPSLDIAFYRMLETIYPFSWRTNDTVVGEAIGTGDGSTTTFSTYFPYAENATVYVNGVAESNVTVTKSSSYTNVIVFATAPEAGAVITADYSTGVIAKDANHVFDFTFVITCGTYSE